MSPAKINKNLLRRKMAAKDIFSFAELARRVNRSPTTIQLMCERPSRFSTATRNVLKVLEISDLSELTNHEPKKEASHV